MNHLVVEWERGNVGFNPVRGGRKRVPLAPLQGRNSQLLWGNVQTTVVHTGLLFERGRIHGVSESLILHG
jgi:hypothetical protein